MTLQIENSLEPAMRRWKSGCGRILRTMFAFLMFAATLLPSAAHAANGAAFISQSVPSTMNVGQTYTVSITMQNTGTTTWVTSNNYNLGSKNPLDNTTWGIKRVAVPVSVAPGGQATFTFNVTAPSTAGTYNFQWGMVQDFVEWFGASSTNLAVNVVVPPVNDAAYVSQTVPTTMTAGKAYSVSITMQNTGGTTWTVNGNYNLGSQNPVDNYTWIPSSNRVSIGTNVSPGSQRTFTFNVTAPSTPGSYNFQWQMVQDFVGWFGAKTPNTVVNVVAPVNNAAYVSQSVPTTMTAGQTYAVSVTMQNTGDTTWTTAGNYNLGSQNPIDNYTWNASSNRVSVGTSIASGVQKTFTFNVTAPTTPGTYNFQWKMVQDYVGWFGALTPNVAITVSGPVLTFSGCSSITPTTSPTAASMTCTLSNTGTAASSIVYGSGTGTSVTSGPTSCAANTTCGTVKVTTNTAAGSYAGTLTATPNVGTKAQTSYNLTVNATTAPALSLTGCSSTTPTTAPTAASMTCTVGNTGGTVATSITYSSSATGTTVSSGPASCAANTASCGTVTVTTGTSAATYSGTLTATPNTGTAGQASFSLVVNAAGVATVTYIHTDGLGSPIARTDASGNVISRTRYEPHGATAAGATPTIGFTGHVNDSDTGLIYMQQRYYDPIAGRFFSVDPVATDVNTGRLFGRYTYVDNNPYTKIDPDGRFGFFGAIIGVGVEVSAQLLTEGKVNNLPAVGVAAAAGLVTGGVGGIIGESVAAGFTTIRAAVTATASVGGATAAVGKVVEGELNGKPASAGQVAIAAGLGGLGAAVGGKIGLATEAKVAEMASKPGVAGHIGQTTQNAMQQGGKISEPITSFAQKAAQTATDMVSNVIEKVVN